MKKRPRKTHGRGESRDQGVRVRLRLPEDAGAESNEEVADESLDYILEHGMRGSIGGQPLLVLGADCERNPVAVSDLEDYTLPQVRHMCRC